MTRLKYLDPADGQYKLLPVGGGGGGAEEVVISAGVLPTKSEELWVDTSVTAPVYDWSYADNRYLSSGFRNVIRNGDFSISQRGNGPFIYTAFYCMDGWLLGFGGGTVSMNRVLPVAGEASPRASVAVSGQSAAGDYCQIFTYVEDVNTLNGKQATLSFDAWATSGNPKIGLEVQQYFGTGGAPSASLNTSISAVTISTTRTRYSATFTLPSVAGATLGTNGNHYLRVLLWLSAGSTYATRSSNIGIQSGTFNITDVQLEEGPAATKFERLPVQQQLAWCQRYFQRYSPAPPLRGVVFNATTASQMGILLPVAMRANPSFTSSGTAAVMYDGERVATVSGITGVSTVGTMFVADMTASGGTWISQGRACLLMPTAGSIYDFSAEL